MSGHTGGVRKLWAESVETHRHGVREAILDATGALVAERGLRSVTMGQIADASGIGRATLYKYFSDIGEILRAWHEREISRHLERVSAAGAAAAAPVDQLAAMLEAYALTRFASGGHDAPIAALLHRDEHVHRAEEQLTRMVRTVLLHAVEAGDVRADVAADELVGFALHAATAARTLPSEAAVRRLVRVTMSGLRAPGG